MDGVTRERRKEGKSGGGVLTLYGKRTNNIIPTANKETGN